jgi:hypothetical protein
MKRPITWRGEKREGTLITPVFFEEPWCRLMLEDGTIIRARHIVEEVIRVDGEYDSEGDQEFVIRWGTILYCYSPEHLKRKEVRDDGKEPDREDRSAG